MNIHKIQALECQQKLMKALNGLTLSLFLLLSSEVAMSQPSEKIETDRSGKAQTPFVAPAKTFQVETGFEWEKNDENQIEIQHPEILIKYGLFNKLELRTRIITATEKFKQPSFSQSGLQPVEVGIKALITEGKKLLPHTSFQAQFGIPGFASENFKADKVFPRLRLNFENEFSDKAYLEYNIAAEWDGFETHPAWFFAISPHLEIGKNWQVFAEVFSYVQNNMAPKHSFDAGITYWITKNVMADFGAGFGLSPEAPKTFIDGGISFRLK